MNDTHRLQLVADALAEHVAPLLRPECGYGHDCNMRPIYFHPATAAEAARRFLDELRRQGLDVVKAPP